jgi:hypothetical protein
MPHRWSHVGDMINRGRLTARGDQFVNVITGRPLGQRDADIVRMIVRRRWAHIAPGGAIRYLTLGAAAVLTRPFGSLSEAEARLLQNIGNGSSTGLPGRQRALGTLRVRRLVEHDGRAWRLTALGEMGWRAADLVDEAEQAATRDTPTPRRLTHSL